MQYYNIFYNKIPDNFINFGFRVVKKPIDMSGDYYWLTGKFSNYDSSFVFANNPKNLMHATFYYSLDSEKIPKNPNIKLFFFPMTHLTIDDPPLSLPLSISVFQDTTFSNEIKWANFLNTLFLGKQEWGDLSTLQFKISQNRVYGRLYSDTNVYIPLSETSNVTLGLTPSFYNGKMSNTKDSIRIFGKWGWYYFGNNNYNQLFLSQTNDAFIQNPLRLIIKDINNNSVIIDKYLYLPEIQGQVNVDYGYPRSFLTFPVKTGKYEIILLNNTNKIDSLNSVIIAQSVCDLGKSDKNPPGLNSFQIIGGNSLSHHLKAGEKNFIRFFPVDNGGIASLKLFYKEKNEYQWHRLDIAPLDKYYFKADIPELNEGIYSLKLVMTDFSNNTLEMKQAPAFIYSKTSEVVKNKYSRPYKFFLSNGYPNPFNMEVNFRYEVPPNTNEKIEISIYNILGEQVRTLVKREAKTGEYVVKWNGRDSHGKVMPTGIYFVKFSSFSKSIIRKIVLLK